MDDLERSLYQNLKLVYGYDEFRIGQLETNCAIIKERRDVFVLMATGSGKSVCYQLPPFALRSRGQRATTIVISPLISLMEDQVTAINAKICLDPISGSPAPKGLPAACFLGSSQTDYTVEQRAIRGEFALVYMTPEKVSAWVRDNKFNQVGQNCLLLCFAIDECHCVSEWGHDFRQEYRNLSDLRDNYPNTPFLALTATATPLVQNDIVNNLKMHRNLLRIRTSFNRTNLRYKIQRKNGKRDIDNIVTLAKSLANNGTLIVYTKTRKEVESVVKMLSDLKISCCAYHAGLSPNQRREAHKAFITDKIQVIVATIAFGMGIDKEDVRAVVHYGLPKSLEGYYQETGRAGRDGNESTCLLLWDDSDLQFLQHVIKDNADKGARCQATINSMRTFAADTETCRRYALLKYFGEMDEKSDSTTCYDIGGIPCDVCQLKVSGVQRPKRNFTADVRILLSAVQETNERFGITSVVDYVLGKSKTARPLSPFSSSASFGKGRHQSLKYWKDLHSLCVVKRLLSGSSEITERFSYTCYKLTTEGRSLLNNPAAELPEWVIPESMSLITKRMKSKLVTPTNQPKTPVDAQEKTVSTSASGKQYTLRLADGTSRAYDLMQELLGVENELFQSLRDTRKQLAFRNNVAPYMIISDVALKQMAIERPTVTKLLDNVPGMTERKIQEYGPAFIKAIKTFCTDKQLKSDLLSPNHTQQQPAQTNNRQVTDSANRTMTMFLQGHDPLTILAARSHEGVNSVSTVHSHLVSCWSSKIGINWDWNLQTRFHIPIEMETMIKTILLTPEEGGRALKFIPDPRDVKSIKLTPIVEDLIGRPGVKVNKDQLYIWVRLTVIKVWVTEIMHSETDIAPITSYAEEDDIFEASPLNPSAQSAVTTKRVRIEETQLFEDTNDTVMEIPSPIPPTPFVIAETQESGLAFSHMADEQEQEQIEFCKTRILDILFEPGASMEKDRLLTGAGSGKGGMNAATKALNTLIADMRLFHDKDDRIVRI